VNTIEYQVQIDDSLYNMKLPSDKYRPHAPHAVWFAVEHHFKCKIAALKRWPHAKGYFYVAQLENGKAILVRVQRLRAKE